MRSLFLIITILFFQTSFAQTTKIKIKKEEPIAKVSLAGVDTGIVTITKILCDKKLMIANNKFKLKIYSYEAFMEYDESTTSLLYNGKNENIPKELLDELQEKIKTETITLRFIRIVAYNEFNETLNLNEIKLKVIPDKTGSFKKFKTTQ